MRDRLLTTEDVRLGLRLREFCAYLQPKFDLRTGQVSAVEVLARWQHPLLGILGPANFIPLMEREQWLDQLLFELIEQCLSYQVRLYNQGRNLGMAFNLSPDQLTSGTLVQRLNVRLRQHPLPLATLTFEITESGPSIVCAAGVEQLKGLRQLGVRLSLDDFGTGYSSLLRLCQLPFSEIKLAGELSRHLDRPGYCAVIRNTLALSEELGVQLVVEGVETEAQRVQLVGMGAGTGQGYLCARPMSIENFDDWFHNYGHHF
ncbi:EAL domain-containing protein (putative c-di-GMP-specific phosphodiesterase class I) [Pseudomonas chlororaphis]|uniref:EAL domain-containing protein n=1 Tax=Pseudomonas chlororaphis TaxID=587753 RepID=UPI0020A0ECF4|nr:EAL domain-containing protein [Pseudomonas chlororaphis]MCP1482002.1 EAL domain-containing protein (putative c-di-GMP-specific phosphodiesterase class I) [Pseudomonas chlororaphis]MCP1597639.1 EAL domain-containing protein (putative c-di-GMP-specific phosphodiesterase class I) [Pseudomonas chlororaphis]